MAPPIRASKPIASTLKKFHSLPHLKLDIMPIPSPHLPTRNIILDFDGTITTKDTISALASFGLRHQKQAGKDFRPAWDLILSRYGEDYAAHTNSYLPRKEDRKTLGQEIEYLRSLRGVETRSFERVSKSGLFKGISCDGWRRAGREMVESGEVEVRKGFHEFMLDVRKRGGRCGVVSVNFSKHFIQGVLEASAGLRPSEIEVVANSVNEDGTICGPGTKDGNSVMATSDAKLDSMRKLLATWADASENSAELGRKAIYFGDSGTDTECLLAEEVMGIVMCENGESSLMEMLQRVQIKIERCNEFTDEGRTLYWASNFNNVDNSPWFGKSSN